MVLRPLVELLKKQRSFKELLARLRSDREILVVAPQPLRPYLIGGLAESLRTKVLVVIAHPRQAEQLSRDITNFTSLPCTHFPDWEIMPGEALSPTIEISGLRWQVLHRLASGEPMVVVAAAKTLLQRFPPYRPEPPFPLELKIGTEIDLAELASGLAKAGYVRSHLVEARGQFSWRGGIFDLFPSVAELPIRLELFGDRIESIRQFSVSSQRSIGQVDRAMIFPARELILTPQQTKQAVELLRQSPTEKGRLSEDIEKLERLVLFEGVERYLPFLFPRLDTLLDYFSSTDLVVINETTEVQTEADRFYQSHQALLKESIEAGEQIEPPLPYCVSFDQLKSAKQRWIEIDAFSPARQSAANFISFTGSAAPSLLGRADEISSALHRLRLEETATVVALPDAGSVRRMAEIITDLGFEAILSPADWQPGPGKIVLAQADLGQGFIFSDLKLALLTESDVFFKKHVPRERRVVEGLPVASLFDLRPGDFVVHLRHGVARFAGLTTEEREGYRQEFLVLEYAEGDRLYVPSDQINRVSKFLGAEGADPKISRLGSSQWQKTRNRARKSVKKLAVDLLNLYAARSAIDGFAFAKDAVWQKELEDSFPYPETRGQISAIKEIKEDMERPRPMDRLICGDVGYGKTEVAIRAAFKAVLDNKQVMVLVPTTILAQQHFNTFCQRLSAFPVVIEMLSRFRSPNEQKEIIERFGQGKIDVLIGTHRLLQKDVKPKDLGLIVIDEEQRFGVGHKEHLRNLRQTVDALTLTATPIPRTLQMSLSGVRDLSIINTPPEERRPVITQVTEYSEETLRLAIRRELQREGQVYYVHNRVETIDREAEKVRELVPEARIEIAHGQMPERRLERIMLDFLAHRFDVLICTTIIESGIDIPLVNTLIVNEAESFGLSQLYQLRGRVGRAHHRAYAYFFYSPAKVLTATALDRLKTIAEFTELGSGLKIALRDLEIRGAGNLLGPEQHGLIQAVGFDLYCEMLRQAVAELKGQPLPKEVDVRVNLPIEAFISRDYIADEAARLETYRRIASIGRLEEAEDIETELSDIYGPVPLPVKNLIEVCRLKVLASRLKIIELSWHAGRMTIRGPFSGLNWKKAEADRTGLRFLVRPDKLVIEPLQAEGILSFLSTLLNDIIPPKIKPDAV